MIIVKAILLGYLLLGIIFLCFWNYLDIRNTGTSYLCYKESKASLIGIVLIALLLWPLITAIRSYELMEYRNVQNSYKQKANHGSKRKGQDRG